MLPTSVVPEDTKDRFSIMFEYVGVFSSGLNEILTST